MGNRYRARESSSYVCIYIYIYIGKREVISCKSTAPHSPGIKMELSLSSQMQPIIRIDWIMGRG